MGQVLGFSHCQEYGSVASTPDSTPPCTDGGNEESELYELQTARDWSEDEEVGYDDDDTLASSPSVWGTPRQNSLELTFSYIAIADAESAGGSRTHRERRRGGSRGSRTSLVRTDTSETPLDSPDGDWDPHGLTSRADEQECGVDVRTASPRRRRRQNETVTMQPSPQSVDVETQEGDTGIRSEESALTQMQPPILPAPGPEPESPVVPAEPLQPTEPQSISPDAIAPDTQENPLNPCWDSALKPSDSAAVWPHITVVGVGGAGGEIILVGLSWGLLSEQGLAKNSSGGSWGARWDREGGKAAKMANKVMDLIYWKDTERTGIILTGLVVGLLCLFQLSIITVVSTVSLAVVCVAMSVRIYYNILHALKWGDGEHPFKSYLEMDISLSGEQAQLYMQKVIVMTLQAVDSLKRLFFVSTLFESLKLLVLLYLVTYLGDLCNGLTLLIIGVIGLFSLPLFYRRHQEKVDGFIGKIQAVVDNVKDFFRRLAHSGALPPSLPPGDDAKEKIQ